MRTNFLQMSRKIGEMRIKEALEAQAEYLITCCPMCYLHLKEAVSKYDVEVLELSEVIMHAMEKTGDRV